MSVFVANEQSEAAIEAGPLHHLAELVVAEEGYPETTEVTILFVSEEEMAGYNEHFLGREGPTDVLAFPVEDFIPGVAPEHDPLGPPILIGDVIVAPTYVRRQAESSGVPFDDEMALMVTHGILHLMGYDHEETREAERMEERERVLLAKVGRERP